MTAFNDLHLNLVLFEYVFYYLQLFDVCLASDTTGDGTGCDNMTCVIVKFTDDKPTKGGDKRPADSSEEVKDDTEIASTAKRPRLTDDSESKEGDNKDEGTDSKEKQS